MSLNTITKSGNLLILQPYGMSTTLSKIFQKEETKQPFKQIRKGKRKSREDTTTIDEEAQLQYKAHRADTDTETTHLEFFLDEKCAQQC